MSPQVCLWKKRLARAVSWLPLLLLWSCDRGNVNRIASWNSLRSADCYVWAFTNLETGEVRFSAHALDTGWVPATGEANFASIPELATAIRKRKFGLYPVVKSGFLGDPNDQTNLVVRKLHPSEEIGRAHV